MKTGLFRSFFMLSIGGVCYFLAVFAGGFDYALPPALYESWMRLFDHDRILAAGAFAIAACIWLGLMFPILFLGKGASLRGMPFMLCLALAACAALRQPFLIGLWTVMFFCFCLNTVEERRAARNGPLAAPSSPQSRIKNGSRSRRGDRPGDRAPLPGDSGYNARAASSRSAPAPGDAIRKAAEAVRDTIIQGDKR